MSETPAWGFLKPSRQSALATPPFFGGGAALLPLAAPFLPAFFEIAMVKKACGCLARLNMEWSHSCFGQPTLSTLDVNNQGCSNSRVSTIYSSWDHLLARTYAGTCIICPGHFDNDIHHGFS